MSARLSPDGMYYWDGQGWVSTRSHDGRSRWNGTAWVPAGPHAFVTYAGAVPLEPTSWTRPLQYAVAGWYVWSAIYTLTIPFWMGGLITQVMNQSIQRQEQLNPNASLPPDFTDTMNSFMTAGIWIAVVFLLAVFLVPFIGALMRWKWVFYAVLVLLGLSALVLPIDLLDAVVAPAMSSTSGFSMPTWFYLLALVTGLPGAAIFVWMLIALITRGPWGMRRAASAG